MLAQGATAINGPHQGALVDTASGTLELALPLILGALAGVLGERSGVVNVAIEGQFLMGAFFAALIGTMATSVWLGLISAALGGVLIAAMLAVLAIRFLVDQVVVGIVLNLFALGVTGFLYERLMQPNAQSFNTPPQMPTWRIPGLADIPVLGPVLFDTNRLVWLALILVVALHFALSRTRTRRMTAPRWRRPPSRQSWLAPGSRALRLANSCPQVSL